MKDYAEKFYKGKKWQDCRNAYAKSVRGLCERCLAKGIIEPGVIVHHKIHLSPENIMDESVALNWDNLELVCRECHAKLHGGVEKRYRYGVNGEILIEPPVREK